MSEIYMARERGWWKRTVNGMFLKVRLYMKECGKWWAQQISSPDSI
jgi:hypothetical protein